MRGSGRRRGPGGEGISVTLSLSPSRCSLAAEISKSIFTLLYYRTRSLCIIAAKLNCLLHTLARPRPPLALPLARRAKLRGSIKTQNIKLLPVHNNTCIQVAAHHSCVPHHIAEANTRHSGTDTGKVDSSTRFDRAGWWVSRLFSWSVCVSDISRCYPEPSAMAAARRRCALSSYSCRP